MHCEPTEPSVQIIGGGGGSSLAAYRSLRLRGLSWSATVDEISGSEACAVIGLYMLLINELQITGPPLRLRLTLFDCDTCTSHFVLAAAWPCKTRDR
jgi:hypothetical protein